MFSTPRRFAGPAAFWVGLALFCGPAARAEHPNLARGFEASKAYAIGDVDHVNLLNGNLILTLPIGSSYHVGGNLSYGLSLVYNGKAWDWHQETGGIAKAMAPWDSNAGFAWQLHFGKLIRPEASQRNDTGLWIYVSPDGAEHSFYTTLHASEAVTPGVFYTRDGTYLRLKVVSSSVVTLEFPDGNRHTFDKMSAVEHWLTRMEDTFGNFMAVSYPAGAASNEWLVSDSTGRSHRFELIDRMLDQRAVKFVSKVELAAFGDTKATYTFTYQYAELDRPVPHDPFTGLPIRSVFPLLIKVTQPDETTWEMPPGYYSRFREVDTGISGQLVKLRMPTRGIMQWTYSRWRFPTDNLPDPNGIPEPASFVEYTTGVASRRMLTANGFEIGKWTYNSALPLPTGFPGVKPVTKTTEVIDPLGHRTVHYFSVWQGEGLPASPRAQIWHYGLPFSVLETDADGRFVSKKTYRAGETNPVRVDWLNYESDLFEGGQPSGTNSRVYSSRVDWLGANAVTSRTRTEVLSDFDGLGHYRNRSVAGDYRNDGGPGNWQNSYTSFNLGRGTYPGSFTQVPTGDRWILGTFSEQWEEEAWGRTTREYVFDSLGFLERERIRLQPSGSRNSNDTVRVLTRNSSGQATREAWYGGYFHPVGTGSLAGLTLPATAAATFDMTYEYGQLKTQRYKDATYYLVDQNIDLNTGYPKSAKDIAGIETGYSYDNMGRRTAIRPAAGHDAWVDMVYTGATPTSTPQAFVYERPNGSTTGLLRESNLTFDDYGRLAKEARNTAAGWSYRQRFYDAAGNLAQLSQWQAGTPAYFTTYQAYDPFGRAESIVAPDGKTLGLKYHGDWGLQRWYYVGSSRSSDGSIQETQTASAEDFDILGRTWRYQELDQSGSLNLDAYYRYTTGGSLAEVRLRAPNGNQQIRSFTFDGRGFLTAENHPETGTTEYSEIDARGHANRKKHTASGLDLGFAYDDYERLTKVYDRTRSADLKVWTYGTGSVADNWNRGKVDKTTHYNRRRNPFVAAGNQWIDVKIEESFEYRGRGGRVSTRTTKLNDRYTFTQSATWGHLGEITQETYPRCTTGGCESAATARTLAYTYQQGELTGITGWGSLTYHDNGMIATVVHQNGVTDIIEKDPWQMARPRNIKITGPFTTAELGRHHYDGGGNLVRLQPTAGALNFGDLIAKPGEAAQTPVAAAILETFFLYDAYGRLRTWNDKTGRSQDYDFDAFGNLTRITDFDGVSPATYRSFAVSQSTNRLTSLYGYDARGNLTSRPMGSISETYEWDLFDQMGTQNFPAATHLYTTEGERLWTLRYTPVTNQIDETFTLRGFGNQVLTVYKHQANTLTGAESWTWEEDYIYRGGGLLAKATGKPAPQNQVHFTLDHLGTPRVKTGSTGQPLEDYHYFPHGEQYGGVVNSAERMRYTGHEKDQNAAGTADDLDYMHARYSSANLGRFLTADPQLGTIGDPQSWNRYAYVRNNPMNFTDPTGEYVVNCAKDDSTCNKKAAAFEAARQALLNHKDERVRAAAAVWGAAGEDNGINVKFGIVETKGASAETVPTRHVNEDGTATVTFEVTIGPHATEIDLMATVGHEGSHISDSNAFAASHTGKAPWFDESKNLTTRETETRAYTITHLVYESAGAKFKRGCKDCTLGYGVQPLTKVNQRINNIIADESGPYARKIDTKVFDTGSGQ